MKTFLFLFLVCIFKNLAYGDHEPIQKGSGSGYPKKYNPVMHRHLNILNRKYVKPIGKVQSQTKKSNTNDGTYTAFPPIPLNNRRAPESPYFPLPVNTEPKTRVKKVLPDYMWKPIVRRKRAAAKNPKASAKNNGKKKPAKKNAAAKQYRKSGKKIRSRKHAHKPDARRQQRRVRRTSTDKRPKPPKGAARRQRRLRKFQPESESRRLIAANDAMIENYPYTISIQKAGEHWCSGALVNQRLAITTANCVWKSKQVSQMHIRAGSRYTDRGGQEAKIQEVMKHPGWSIRKNPDNDVAVLLLDRYLKFSHGLHGVDLPNRVMLPVFDDAWVTSWGAERRDGIYDKPEMTLQVYHARLLNREVCNNVTQRFGVTVTSNFICLAQSGRRAPCTRDTGAPAVSDGVLWGVASWGIRKLCGTERFPAVFSFLASHSNMDFLSKATTRLMSENREYPYPDRYVHEPHVTTTTQNPEPLHLNN